MDEGPPHVPLSLVSLRLAAQLWDLGSGRLMATVPWERSLGASKSGGKVRGRRGRVQSSSSSAHQVCCSPPPYCCCICFCSAPLAGHGRGDGGQPVHALRGRIQQGGVWWAVHCCGCVTRGEVAV